jgi:hypothetical protein
MLSRQNPRMVHRSPRPDRRRAFFASTAWLIGPLLPMNSVLARALIDDDPAIDALAHQITKGRSTERERAVALHDYVRDEIRFGFTPHFYEMSAADVLAAGVGYSHNKTTLFVTLLRAAGIEARQQFVDLDAGIWRGLLDLHTPFVDHSFTEVRLGGAWVATDSYIVDRQLFRAARATLASRRLSRGYGIVATGRIEWDGSTPSFVQFGGDDPITTSHRWGVFPDVNAFYRQTPDAWNRRDDVTRVIYPLAALAANHAAESLRTRGPAAIRGTRTA